MPPAKSVYHVGESLDLTGAMLGGQGFDGTENWSFHQEPLADHPEWVDTSAFDNTTPGTYQIPVRVKGWTVNLTITVLPGEQTTTTTETTMTDTTTTTTTTETTTTETTTTETTTTETTTTETTTTETTTTETTTTETTTTETTTTETTTTEPITPPAGDVDGNGKLEIADAVRFMRWLAESDAPQPFDDERADLDCDGIITLGDLYILLDRLTAVR